MDFLLWIVAGFWCLSLVTLLLNRRFIPDLSRSSAPPPARWPSVSIVVPARDEERSVGAAVASFCEQDYPDFEVVVVDDRSQDSTPAILDELSRRYPRMKVLRGEDPPEGWLGKPNALETGRKAAVGVWLLFVDADVIYAPDLLRRAVAFTLKEDAGMLFLAPRFTTGGVVEAALMSALYFVGFAFLPAFLAFSTRWKWLAAGGGVFNLVRRDALEASGAFANLRDAVVDDMGLGFRVKGAGFRLAGALAGPLMHIRMYDGARATVRGFMKNTYPGIRQLGWGAPLLLLALAPASLLVHFFPYVAMALSLSGGPPSLPAAVALLLMHAVFAGLAITFRQPWYLTFLNPVREAGWWWILLRSYLAYRREGLVWRGRKYLR